MSKQFALSVCRGSLYSVRPCVRLSVCSIVILNVTHQDCDAASVHFGPTIWVSTYLFQSAVEFDGVIYRWKGTNELQCISTIYLLIICVRRYGVVSHGVRLHRGCISTLIFNNVQYIQLTRNFFALPAPFSRHDAIVHECTTASNRWSVSIYHQLEVAYIRQRY